MAQRINYMRMASSAAAQKPALDPTGIPGVDRYRVYVPTKILELTTQKFDLARLPHDFEQGEGKDWDDGTPKKVVEDLIDYWQDNYSWRREEAKLNTFPQFRTALNPGPDHDPLRVHFIWKKSPRENAVPLLLLHGWPSSPFEFSKVIIPLSEPSDESKLAFHVVVPSLPGFGFSDNPTKPGVGVKAFGKMFHELMGKLGYPRYLVHGTDWGGFIGRSMCVDHPQAVIAYHSHFFPVGPPSPLKSPVLFLKTVIGFLSKGKIGLNTQEYEMLVKLQQWHKTETAYQEIQSTKPLSLAFGLTDSPVGSLAWIREKLHGWSDDYAWTEDEVLTWWMMIWLPGPFAGMRLYKQSGRYSAEAKEIGTSSSTVPLGISVYQNSPTFPAEWAHVYQPVKWKRTHTKGGHFAAFECPDVMMADLHDFFTPIVKADSTLSSTLAEKPKGKVPETTTAPTAASPPATSTAIPEAAGVPQTLQVPQRPVAPSPQSSGSQVPIIKKDRNGEQVGQSPPVGVHELAGTPTGEVGSGVSSPGVPVQEKKDAV